MLWIRREQGPALIPHNSLVQIIRNSESQLQILLSPKKRKPLLSMRPLSGRAFNFNNPPR